MSPVVIGGIGILFLFLLLAMRMQIGFSMAMVGFLGFAILGSLKPSFTILGMEPFKIGGSYSLTVIPLFILMGQFANHSRMGSEIYQTVYRWIGFLPGGLSMATIGACGGFAAISGSSLAAAATMGMVALPEMKRFEYDDSLATGCIAAGGTLGILIPPSTVMIIYGILTQQPIATLFIAGILPGLLLTVLFILTIYIMTKLDPTLGPPGPSFSMKERIYSLKDTWGIIALFLLVIGGLYTGWFTPTEAAGVGAFGAFLITITKGRLTWRNLTASLDQTARTTAMVFLILIGASIFGYFLTVSQIPDQLSLIAMHAGLNRYIILSLIIIAYIILGCFMEGLAIMVLTIPIIYPMVLEMGFDPIWFGVIITLVMEMSLITPPVGINVFIISGIAKDVPMYTIFRGIIPFWFAMLACIILLVLFPQIALFLPQTMRG
ncbi:MAG: TRAP transporter large permease [Deltaproteobacteria bacterium]|nr:TRAP transporter large permease [Deltaproteobacteria bacterium]MBW1928038.1 TRAP transporter large permease [Deltaproteobacteria bacterium]MBW2024972.1 TRAP transporter large permease [Deltaproteobacteria bacterium]MBW2127077.1 TRAP transporter large permease [Deltaproteobacteria bacterium]